MKTIPCNCCKSIKFWNCQSYSKMAGWFLRESVVVDVNDVMCVLSRSSVNVCWHLSSTPRRSCSCGCSSRVTTYITSSSSPSSRSISTTPHTMLSAGVSGTVCLSVCPSLVAFDSRPIHSGIGLLLDAFDNVTQSQRNVGRQLTK